MTRLARATLLLVGAGLGVVAATLLWRTSVPHLDAPRLHARSVFGGSLVERTGGFDRLLRILWLLGVVARIAALALVARRSVRLRLAVGRVGGALVVTALAVAGYWAASLAPDGVALWWTRRHGLTSQSYGSLAIGELEALAFLAAAAWAAVAVFAWLAARTGRGWWIPGAAVASAAAIVVTLAGGAFVGGSSPARLVTEERALAAREGVSPPRLVVESPPGGARTANADAVGIGPTRRIALWRTIVRPPFDRREVRFVIAHELGHHARRHLWKGIAWFALLSLPVLALADVVAPALARAEWIARALLAVFLAQLALLPLENAVSRRYAAEADWAALRATRDPAAARGLYVDLARVSLLQPNPPTWSYVWLDTHPTLLQRVEQAAAYAATRASRGGS